MWRWAFGYLRPYDRRISVLTLLSILEVGLRVLLPWPMKAIVDQALGSQPAAAWLLAVAGITVQFAHSRLFTLTGTALTRDLRQRLFDHLQGLALRHHSRIPIGDAVYRLEADAAGLEQLLLRGVFPMVFSAL